MTSNLQKEILRKQNKAENEIDPSLLLFIQSNFNEQNALHRLLALGSYAGKNF